MANESAREVTISPFLFSLLNFLTAHSSQFTHEISCIFPCARPDPESAVSSEASREYDFDSPGLFSRHRIRNPVWKGLSAGG